MATLDLVVGENLMILARLVCDVGEPHLLAQASDPPLTRNQFAILKVLCAEPTTKVGGLARMLNISCAAASKNVDRLHHLGLVERLAKPDDRRGLDVVLLPRGRSAVAAYDRLMESRLSAQIGQFTPQEKEHLLVYLRRIIRATVDREPSPEMICLLCDGHGAGACAVRESKGICLRAEG